MRRRLLVIALTVVCLSVTTTGQSESDSLSSEDAEYNRSDVLTFAGMSTAFSALTVA